MAALIVRRGRHEHHGYSIAVGAPAPSLLRRCPSSDCGTYLRQALGAATPAPSAALYRAVRSSSSVVFAIHSGGNSRSAGRHSRAHCASGRGPDSVSLGLVRLGLRVRSSPGCLFCRARRFTEWRPDWATWQLGGRQRAAIGELTLVL